MSTRIDDKVYNVNNNLSKNNNNNIYSELAKLPKEAADLIITRRTTGGRCLEAIWHADLISSEKLVLICFGSQLNFTQEFVGQKRYISVAKIAKMTSLSDRTISNIMNGYVKDGTRMEGLIERGYLIKILASVEKQKLGHSNDYLLTSKVFDEYVYKLIEEAKLNNSKTEENLSTNNQIPPLQPLHPPPATIAPKVPKQAPSDKTDLANTQNSSFASSSVVVVDRSCKTENSFKSAEIEEDRTILDMSNTRESISNDVLMENKEEIVYTQKNVNWKVARPPTTTKKKEEEILITTGFASNWTDELKRIYEEKFIDYNLVTSMLKRLATNKQLTLHDLTDLYHDLSNQDLHTILKAHRFDLRVIEADLSLWITSKDKIAAEAERKRNLPILTKEQQQQQNSMEYSKMIRDEHEHWKREEEEKNMLQKRAEEFDTLPQNFIAWHAEQEPIKRIMILKQFQQIGIQAFKDKFLK